MFADAATSTPCSCIAFLTWWLVMPLLVLLPLSVFFACRFYKKMVVRFKGSAVLARVFGLAPMAIALATSPAIEIFFEGSYRV